MKTPAQYRPTYSAVCGTFGSNLCATTPEGRSRIVARFDESTDDDEIVAIADALNAHATQSATHPTPTLILASLESDLIELRGQLAVGATETPVDYSSQCDIEDEITAKEELLALARTTLAKYPNA